MVRRVGRLLGGLVMTVTLLLAGPLWMLASGQVALGGHWSAASRAPAGLAPSDASEAVVQVYAARAWGWRGAFGVHTWLATRRSGADTYRMHHVLSWRRPAVVSQSTVAPDRAWYGNAPVLLADYRGRPAAAMIEAIEAAVAAYPAPDDYHAWPGPNSNTFTAWVVRAVPRLEVVLPVTAVGKDYLPDGMLAPAPGGAGVTLALGGLLGLTVARDEGLEFNLLGLAWGFDIKRPALKLPGLGRLGMAPVIKGRGAGHASR